MKDRKHQGGEQTANVPLHNTKLHPGCLNFNDFLDDLVLVTQNANTDRCSCR